MARDESAIEFDDLGRWWGNDPQRKQEAEIDIVGIGGTHVVLAGECKWRNEDFPASALEKLRLARTLLAMRTRRSLRVFRKPDSRKHAEQRRIDRECAARLLQRHGQRLNRTARSTGPHRGHCEARRRGLQPPCGRVGREREG